MGMLYDVEKVGRAVAAYPGEWVIVDGHTGIIVAHNVELAAAFENTPAGTALPNAYYVPKDGSRQITFN